MTSDGRTPGPYEARYCPGMPTACCDYGVVSLSAGREVCRVWNEEDARMITEALSRMKAAPPVVEFTVTDQQLRAERERTSQGFMECKKRLLTAKVNAALDGLHQDQLTPAEATMLAVLKVMIREGL